MKAAKPLWFAASFFAPTPLLPVSTPFSGLVWENGAGVFLPFFKNASVNFGDGESESNTSFTTISGLFGRFDFRIFTLTGLDPNQPYEYEFKLL